MGTKFPCINCRYDVLSYRVLQTCCHSWICAVISLTRFFALTTVNINVIFCLQATWVVQDDWREKKALIQTYLMWWIRWFLSNEAQRLKGYLSPYLFIWVFSPPLFCLLLINGVAYIGRIETRHAHLCPVSRVLSTHLVQWQCSMLYSSIRFSDYITGYLFHPTNLRCLDRGIWNIISKC